MNYKKATVALTRLAQTMQSLSDQADNAGGSGTVIKTKSDEEKP